ncbi:hypothetical protein G9A89_023376 [Geosiphon pyriformis]|nr:hypothetical protein G9A89_023376 [Geosiphon pyriformis]
MSYAKLVATLISIIFTPSNYAKLPVNSHRGDSSQQLVEGKDSKANAETEGFGGGDSNEEEENVEIAWAQYRQLKTNAGKHDPIDPVEASSFHLWEKE